MITLALAPSCGCRGNTVCTDLKKQSVGEVNRSIYRLFGMAASFHFGGIIKFIQTVFVFVST